MRDNPTQNSISTTSDADAAHAPTPAPHHDRGIESAAIATGTADATRGFETEPATTINLPPPCYFWNVCGQQSSIEKAGRSLCANCSPRVTGYEYPLRAPSREPLYASTKAAAEALNLSEEES